MREANERTTSWISCKPTSLPQCNLTGLRAAPFYVSIQQTDIARLWAQSLAKQTFLRHNAMGDARRMSVKAEAKYAYDSVHSFTHINNVICVQLFMDMTYLHMFIHPCLLNLPGCAVFSPLYVSLQISDVVLTCLLTYLPRRAKRGVGLRCKLITY